MFLSACNAPKINTQLSQLARQTFSSSEAGRNITIKEVASIPSASIGYRVGNTNEKILLLSSQTSEDRLWTSANNVVFVTREGRIVRTVGLAHNFSAYDVSRSKSVPSPAQALKAPFISSRIVDYPDLSAYGSLISCNARASGRQVVTILGKKRELARVDEDCRGESLDWSFKDSYWIEPEAGFVWRSIQHTHPKLDPIGMQVLRRPD